MTKTEPSPDLVGRLRENARAHRASGLHWIADDLEQAIKLTEAAEASEPVAGEKHRIIQLSDERGDFVTGPDGVVIWWPDDMKHGALNAWHLRTLADELDSRNAELFAEWGRVFSHPQPEAEERS